MTLTLSTFKATRGYLQSYGDASAVLKVGVYDETVIDNEDELVVKITDLSSEVTGGTYAATTLTGVAWDLTGDIPALVADDVTIVGLDLAGPSPLPRYYVVFCDAHDDTDRVDDLVAILEATPAAIVGDQPITWPAGIIATLEEGQGSGFVTGGGLPEQTGHDGEVLRTDGTDPQWANLGLVIADAPSKVTPGDNDKIAISDSDASDVVKRVAFADLVAALPAGSGDVVGPASATNNSLARFDGTTGKLLKDGAVIGTDVQAYHANLAALAGLSFVADRLPYANGTGTLALATFTSYGRTLAALSNSAALMADLSGQAGADFSLNTHKLTGLAPGTADTDAANVGQTRKRAALIADSGTRYTTTSQGVPLIPMESAGGVTTTAVPAGALYWCLFDCAEPGTITSFQFSVTATSLSSGQTVDVAMFDIAADNGPGARLWNQSVTVGNTTGTKRVTGLSLARPTRGALAFINPSGNAGSVTVLMAIPSGSPMWDLGQFTANRTAMVRAGVSAMPSDLTSSNFTIGGSDFLTQAVPLILGRA